MGHRLMEGGYLVFSFYLQLFQESQRDKSCKEKEETKPQSAVNLDQAMRALPLKGGIWVMGFLLH